MTAESAWPTAKPPLIIVLSGPSGAGKSTLLQAFLSRHRNFQASVSATTRAPRPGEVDGQHYYFLSVDAFEQQREAGAFAEYACVFGRNYYATPKQPILDSLDQGTSIIMDVDLQGSRQLRDNLPQAVHIFIMPPSAAELERRLRGRGTEDDAVIADRLRTAQEEIAAWPEYDYCLVNDDLEETLSDLTAIVSAESCRSDRRRATSSSIVQD